LVGVKGGWRAPGFAESRDCRDPSVQVSSRDTNTTNVAGRARIRREEKPGHFGQDGRGGWDAREKNLTRKPPFDAQGKRGTAPTERETLEHSQE
jgi:hypothetical protein